MVSRSIFLFLLFFTSCASLSQIFKKESNNYFSPDFKCSSLRGWNDSNKFDSFIKIWDLIRSKYYEENKKIGKADVVIVGNSLVHLFSEDLLKKEFQNIQIVQRGIGGDMTDLLLNRMSDNVLNLQPKSIIIEIGGNDLLNGKCLSFIENNIKEIISLIRKTDETVKIIFLSVPPTRNYSLNAIVPVYNIFLIGLTKKYPSVFFIDAWTEMREKDSPYIKEEFARPNDKIHFNEKGYELWGRLLRPLL